MSAPSPRRAHLVERAADAARAAIAADASGIARSPLAPMDVLRSVVEAKNAPQAQHGQAYSPPGHNELPPVILALLHKAGLVDDESPLRDEIALVREQVLRTVEATPAAEGRQARLVLITSAHGGEGKSFTALNLAASIAEGAHRPVILVDAERSAGSLTVLLGLQDAPGLEQLLDTDISDPVELLRRTEIPGLLVLPRGAADSKGTADSTMANALLRLARRLSDHLVVLDTPACLESSTAGLLAGAVGQIALVVEAERTKRAEVEAALDVLDACPTLQLLLNRAALRVNDGFGGAMPRGSDAGGSAQS